MKFSDDSITIEKELLHGSVALRGVALVAQNGNIVFSNDVFVV